MTRVLAVLVSFGLGLVVAIFTVRVLSFAFLDLIRLLGSLA